MAVIVIVIVNVAVVVGLVKQLTPSLVWTEVSK